jgi:hypothetical protein
MGYGFQAPLDCHSSDSCSLRLASPNFFPKAISEVPNEAGSARSIL